MFQYLSFCRVRKNWQNFALIPTPCISFFQLVGMWKAFLIFVILPVKGRHFQLQMLLSDRCYRRAASTLNLIENPALTWKYQIISQRKRKPQSVFSDFARLSTHGKNIKKLANFCKFHFYPAHEDLQPILILHLLEIVSVLWLIKVVMQK